jgi:hypothetical protein
VPNNAVGDALKDLAKKFGRKIGSLSDVVEPTEALTTANLTVDYLTGVGGLPLGRIVELYGQPSAGKAQPLDALVLTPAGFVPMGSLCVGDFVIDPCGQSSRVLGIYPQGVRAVYRVLFSDGSSCEATDDHLWSVYIGSRPSVRTVTTRWLREWLASGGHGRAARPSLPELEPVDLLEADAPLPIDPYLLGLLLGDGTLGKESARTTSFTSADPELVEAAKASLPAGVTMRLRTQKDATQTWDLTGCVPRPEVQPCRRCDRSVRIRARGLCDGCYEALRFAGGLDEYQAGSLRRSIMSELLKELGLWGVGAAGKFVPERYKLTSAKARLAVLQGLMDTDGGFHSGAAHFSSASERLRDDVAWLARSLGLKARVWTRNRTTYTYRGQRLQGLPAYMLSINERADLRVFRLQRKLRRLPAPTSRHLVAIDYVRDAECQCIEVSADSRLYVTDDFIPTHNTTTALQAAAVLQHQIITVQPCIASAQPSSLSRSAGKNLTSPAVAPALPMARQVSSSRERSRSVAWT